MSMVSFKVLHFGSFTLKLYHVFFLIKHFSVKKKKNLFWKWQLSKTPEMGLNDQLILLLCFWLEYTFIDEKSVGIRALLGAKITEYLCVSRVCVLCFHWARLPYCGFNRIVKFQNMRKTNRSKLTVAHANKFLLSINQSHFYLTKTRWKQLPCRPTSPHWFPWQLVQPCGESSGKWKRAARGDGMVGMKIKSQRN